MWEVLEIHRSEQKVHEIWKMLEMLETYEILEVMWEAY